MRHLVAFQVSETSALPDSPEFFLRCILPLGCSSSQAAKCSVKTCEHGAVRKECGGIKLFPLLCFTVVWYNALDCYIVTERSLVMSDTEELSCSTVQLVAPRYLIMPVSVEIVGIS